MYCYPSCFPPLWFTHYYLHHWCIHVTPVNAVIVSKYHDSKRSKYINCDSPNGEQISTPWHVAHPSATNANVGDERSEIVRSNWCFGGSEHTGKCVVAVKASHKGKDRASGKNCVLFHFPAIWRAQNKPGEIDSNWWESQWFLNKAPFQGEIATWK